MNICSLTEFSTISPYPENIEITWRPFKCSVALSINWLVRQTCNKYTFQKQMLMYLEEEIFFFYYKIMRVAFRAVSETQTTSIRNFFM